MTWHGRGARKEHMTGDMTTLPDGTYAEWRGLTHPIAFVTTPPATVDLRWAGPMPPPEGFEEGKPGQYWKLVPKSELTALFELRTFGMWKDERCLILARTQDQRLHLEWTGHNQSRATELGFSWIERGHFETVVPSSEVTDLRQERTEIPLA